MKSTRRQNHFLKHFIFLFFVFTLLNASVSFAGPSRTTYQAKIVKPDGYPLEAASVNFRFTILDPSGSCMIYAENYTAVNMTNTGGLISFSLGSGVKVFPVSATTFEQVFSNITPNLACDTGGGAPAVYTPLANDARKILMQFHDGGGWQTLPAMNINAVPYAMYANDSQKFNGLAPSDFVQVSTLPTCTASQALRFTGAGFQCVAVGGGVAVSEAAITAALGYTPADGASFATLTSSLNTANSTISSVSTTVFSVSSTVSSLENTVTSFSNSVAVSFATLIASPWTLSGTTVSNNSGSLVNVSGSIQISGTLKSNGVNLIAANGNNLFVGDTGGASTTTAGTLNVALGYHALDVTTSGTQNVGVGAYALASSTDGSNNIAIGQRALQFDTSSTYNVAVGTFAMRNTTSGSRNIALGHSSLRYVSGTDNVAIGYNVMSGASVSGSNNIVIGANQNVANLLGSSQLNIGGLLYGNLATPLLGVGVTAPTARLQILAGNSSYAPIKLTSGALLASPQSGTIEYDGFNFYITDGTNTRRAIASPVSATTVDYSSVTTALGFTPASSVSFTTLTSTVNSVSTTVTSLTNSVAASFASLPSGWRLTGNAGTSATTDFMGTTDISDVMFRRNNIHAGMIGGDSTSFGKRTLPTSSTGVGNSAFGLTTLHNNLTGSYNTAIGHAAGYNFSVPLATNSNSTFLGAEANSTVDGLTNVTAIGYQAQATQSNQMVFGNSSIVQNNFSGQLTTYATDSNSGIQVVALTATTSRYPAIAVVNYHNGFSGHPVFSMTNAGGIASAATPLLAHNTLGTILFNGQTTSSQTMQGARIDALADANFASNSAPSRLAFSVAGSSGFYQQKMVLNSQGFLGVGGQNSPTAYLHVTAGTSSVAPVKITPGPLLTSPQSGSIEYDGTFFYTTNSAGVRSPIATGSTGTATSFTATSGLMNVVDLANTVGSSNYKSTYTGSDSNGLVWHVGVSGAAQTLDMNSRFTGVPITMTIGGSEKMRILGSSGNVGIGTQTPIQKLDVQGYIRSASGAGGLATDGGRLYLGLNYSGASFDMGMIGAYTTLAGDDGSGVGALGGIAFSTKSTTGATSHTERMVIDYLGNVGIGNSAPLTPLMTTGVGYNLHADNRLVGAFVKDAVAFNGLFFGYNPNEQTANITAGGTSSNLAFWTNNGANFAERARFNPIGYLGIGTKSPVKALQVVSGAAIGSTAGFPAAYAAVENEFHSGSLKKWTETSGNQVNVGTYSMVAPLSSSTKSNHGIANIFFTDIPSGVSSTGANHGFYTMAFRNRYAGNSDNGYVATMVGIRNEYGHTNDVPGNNPQTNQVIGTMLAPLVSTGSIGALYDLYISAPTGGGSIGNHFAIRQDSLTAKNYFGGRMGLGTENPAGSLHLVTESLQSNAPTSGIFMGKSLSGDYQMQLTQTGGTPHIDFARTSGADYDARISSPGNSLLSLGTASNVSLLNLYQSNVGIGTTNPAYKLEVVSGAIMSSNAYSNNGLGYSSMGGGAGYAFNETHFSVATDDGDVPYYSMHRGGHTAWQLGMLAGTFVIANGGGPATGNLFPAQHFAITTDGFVGIGTTAPDDKFVVNNGTTIGRYTVGGWVTTSDRRNKHDIKDLNNSLEKILQLRGVEYIFNNDPNNTKQIGFIAQETEKVFPQVVTTDSKGFKSMVYANLVAPLVEAVKTLYVKLNENILETRQNSREIASLQQENEKLKDENQKKAKELDDVKARLERLEKLLNSN